MTIRLLADDGKGNIAPAIRVNIGQRFWFKGNADPNKAVDIWFDEYEPYPPHNYKESHWLCTVESNDAGYFDTFPYDTCTIEDTGSTDEHGNKIYRLVQAKQGAIWQGPMLGPLAFTATSGDDKSNVVTVGLAPTTMQSQLMILIGLGAFGALLGALAAALTGGGKGK